MVRFSCKGCTDRHAECHPTCEKYIAEKAECERIRQLRNKESQSFVRLNSNGVFFSGRNPNYR